MTNVEAAAGGKGRLFEAGDIDECRRDKDHEVYGGGEVGFGYIQVYAVGLWSSFHI